jgi:hypothetical protein
MTRPLVADADERDSYSLERRCAEQRPLLRQRASGRQSGEYVSRAERHACTCERRRLQEVSAIDVVHGMLGVRVRADVRLRYRPA